MARGPFEVPERLRRHIEAVLGDDGRGWLATLPDAIAQACERWSLEPEEPFADLTYAWVAPVRRADGSPAVLKLGWPHEEAVTGVAALRIFDGRGAVRLLDADAERCWLLMERLSPGGSLAPLDDESATRILARVMARLHREPPRRHALPTVERWWRDALDRGRGRVSASDSRLPSGLLRWCERALASLEADGRPRAVLHGDLHHRNVLSASGTRPARSRDGETWLAIDPKGVVGDPAFEPGAFLRNPLPELAAAPHLAQRLARRLDLLAAATGFERDRIAAWGAVGSAISAIWCLEAGDENADHTIACALHLARAADPGALPVE